METPGQIRAEDRTIPLLRETIIPVKVLEDLRQRRIMTIRPETGLRFLLETSFHLHLKTNRWM
jgi:hypothetical protein